MLATSSEVHENYTARELSADDIATKKKSFCVSITLQHTIEVRTKKQSQTEEWHRLQFQRIMAYICGKILIQKKKTVSLLHQCLYPKPLLDPLPLPIAWG